MMSNGGSSHHYNNVPQQHPQPIPLSQIQPLMGTTSFPQPNPRRIYHQPPPQQQQQHPISIQRMMLETTYPINNSGNGFSASSTSSSGSSAPPLIRGYFGGRKLYENVDKQPCITCNEMVPSDQLSQLACGHRQCIQCLSMMGQLDKCPNCYSMGIFGGTHIREAFNSETSSPILGISTGNSHGIVMRNGSNSTLSTPLSIQNLKFNDYNIWEPLPLNQQNSTTNEKSDQTNLSKLFDNLSLKQQQLCTNCDEKSIITSFCVDCNEFLCAICVMAHARVKLTKDHQIQQLIEQKNDLLSQKCSEHDNLTYFIKCLTCNGTNLCIKCLQFHPKHSLKFLQTKTTNDMKILLKNLINDTKIIQLLLKNNYENVNKMEEKLQLSIEKVIMEMTNVINLYMKIIDEKKDELLKKIDTIQTTKICLLKNQNEKIYEKITTFEKLLNYSDEIIKSGNDKEIFDYYEQILKLHCENLSTTFFPITNDEIFFKLSVEKNFLNELKNFGNIDSGIDPSSTQIIGNRFKRAISGRPFVVNIQMKDVLGEIVTKESRENGGEFIATLYGPLNTNQCTIQHAEIMDRENGICTLMFTPKNVGIYRLNITYCQIPINGCPTEITVSSGRDYKDAQYQGQKFCFGKEGSGDGEFSRPWGICCDLKGRIIVADRSNHRIQIFDSRGKFLMKFGQKGMRPGDFNRPAGVCVNPSNNIIVADKDNHRIQIFYDDGRYSHGFGTRGCSTGCFNYPWGVATNNNYEIAVTDTRNHRIQLFTSTGIVLRTFMIDVGMKRSPSSPRGICFFPDNELIISDFNTHRLAVVNKNGESQFYGLEGTSPGFFHRPQGIAIDPDGLILVCDSRSNRIQVLNLHDLTVVAVFGNDVKYSKIEPISDPATKILDSNLFHQIQDDSGNLPEETITRGVNLLEHPMDVAISPEGLVYVVDFGNNCIRVY